MFGLLFPCGGGRSIANFLTGKILPINHFLPSAMFLRGLDALNDLRSQTEALYIFQGKQNILWLVHGSSWLLELSARSRIIHVTSQSCIYIMLRHSAFRTCRSSLVSFAFLVGERKLLEKYFHLDYSVSGYELFDLQSIPWDRFAMSSVRWSCLLKWGHPVVSAQRAERTSSPEQASMGSLERYSCLECCCSATLFSVLGAICHFQTTSLSWYFDP